MLNSFVQHHRVKICIIGSASVGKSALTVRFLTRRFIFNYCSQEFSHQHFVTVNLEREENSVVPIEILDCSTASPETNCDAAINWSNCVVLVYSVVNSGSLEYLQSLKSNLSPKTGTSQDVFPPDDFSKGVVVGNKVDLEHLRTVPKEDAMNFADSIGFSYHELSCVDGDQIERIISIFENLVQSYCDQQQTVQPDQSPLTRKSSRSSIRFRDAIDKIIKSKTQINRINTV